MLVLSTLISSNKVLLHTCITYRVVVYTHYNFAKLLAMVSYQQLPR